MNTKLTRVKHSFDNPQDVREYIQYLRDYQFNEHGIEELWDIKVSTPNTEEWIVSYTTYKT